MLQIVAVVRGDERNAGFARETHNLRVDALFDFQALVLNFQEEVSLPENIPQAVGGFARLVRPFFHEIFGDRAAQAGRQCDQTAAVFRQQVVIDSGLVIETFEVSRGDELDQIAVALRIFAEQNEVIVCRAAPVPPPRDWRGHWRHRAAAFRPRSCRLPFATYTSQPMIGFTPRVLAAW